VLQNADALLFMQNATEISIEQPIIRFVEHMDYQLSEA